jgi:DNA-binding response OmpR family regulator
MRVLIVEDNPQDVRLAAEIARAAGFDDIETCISLDRAIIVVEEGLQGKNSLPDVIILDLNLGYESGYELLRIWRTNWEKAKLHVIVWSALEERNRELCALFRVDAFVSKWDGEAELREALQQLNGAGSIVAN